MIRRRGKPPQDDDAARQTKSEKVVGIQPTLEERAIYWYKKIVIEGILRQRPLRPSKDGRHVPVDVERGQPLVDERRGGAYISNTIRTARYTPLDFFPKQFFFQFSRLGNFYFLCVGIPQTIPGLSTTGNFTTILPLLFFVLLTVIKEGYDDYRRHRLDKLENANSAKVLGNALNRRDAVLSRKWAEGFANRVAARWKKPVVTIEEKDSDSDGNFEWMRTKWESLQVGDVIKLRRDEPLPADVVLLYASGENGIAYIETMALDGETNLKTRLSAPEIKGCSTIAGIRACHAEFVLEDPNPDLYRFDGKVIVDGRSLPVTSNEVVYRGSTLRNTECAIGLVINTGEECKIRMNANQHPHAKKPAIERVTNRIVLTLAFYVVILSVGCSMGYLIWQKSTEQYSWYLTDAAVPFVQIIIGFAIQFNNVVPLALYVSLEIVKIGQLLMLNSDIEMYDEASDTPARCNTNTILENLGQVSYIFSDKTGTLTENVMKFRKMSIAGTSWIHEMDLQNETTTVNNLAGSDDGSTKLPRKSKDIPTIITEDTEAPLSPASGRPSLARRSTSGWRSISSSLRPQPELTTVELLEYIRTRPTAPFARKARDYILSVALCHTCLPETKNGELDFQASSPDELALVRAAQDLGYLMINRSSQSITLEVTATGGNKKTEVFEILDVIEFSSKRKRMSIIVRYPDGRICIICKGADSMILPRLALSHLAMQKAHEVRKSVEIEHELHRRSEQLEPRNSFGGRPSLTIRRSYRDLKSPKTPTFKRNHTLEPTSIRPSDERPRPSLGVRSVSLDAAKATSLASPTMSYHVPDKFSFLEDPVILDESEVFTRCFRHLDDFATEGLRTLLFARKFIPEQEYQAWKKGYDDATTSLVDRQEKIEAAGELIEQALNLVGATAIEDKLQAGVPETIDRLRRANIKIWMLTGDKRETAINIAHAARICRPGSDIWVLDASKGALEEQIVNATEDIRTGCTHSVVVIDGQTLASVEASAQLHALFYGLIPMVDSVICCRASPAQKSHIVQAIRRRVPKALTLAIGDGANDLAMISASHVGVGISGKEGLQAARVADYAIAQFRFLQRLLLVHGRWNYIRTAKFILATFWKEMFFYLPTALYQRYNGYTGTSLYESASLTVFNTLFTSLCVIIPGIWEQDLRAETLLAVPELYVYGQRGKALNLGIYIAWMVGAVAEGVGLWFGVWAGVGYSRWGPVLDDNLFALGNLAFTVGVLWINWKLFIIETHHKTRIVLISFAITFIGWFIWQLFLAGIYTPSPSPYDVKYGFLQTFGRDPVWWLTLLGLMAILIILEMAYKATKRNLQVLGLWKWPPWKRRKLGPNLEDWDLELWQEMEQDPAVRMRLRHMCSEDFDVRDTESRLGGIVMGECPEDDEGIFTQGGIALSRMA